ncbi:retrotransposon protein, putative, ty1-copia subclass [Tanacetum coccineum]
MKYLVNISKRGALWSLNEDILKITILTTNTSYPSRKIWRIRACTHQRPQRKQVQYAVSSEDQYAVLEISVVSVSSLVDNGFVQRFMDYGILVSKNDVLYFNDILRDGIYEIDMLNLVSNVNSIYNVSNKRAKHNLDSTSLWHCRLAHISKKRIEKLQHDGLLKSTDDESFHLCVSCLSSKMTNKPFPHQTERATDLLGLIHTDVYGPLRHVSRQVFETFKVIKNEVENQLGNTIKALRSDRGDEYISQEFNDYLKVCGIDYALESATRIVNMVPTNKVDKTPYELWAAKLKEIQDGDTPPAENTIEHLVEAESLEPQEDVAPIRRSVRTYRAPKHLGLNVEGEEHILGDLNEPSDYKVALSDHESTKWIDSCMGILPRLELSILNLFKILSI